MKKAFRFLGIIVLLVIIGFSITACDDGNGNENGGDTATVPGAVASFTATAGDGEVVLDWTAPTDNGGSAITGYEVTMNNWTNKVEKAATELTHTYTDLDNGTEYTFKVRAVNAKGAGAEETETATPNFIITNAAELEEYLAAADGGNTADDPLHIFLNVNDLGGNSSASGSIGNIIRYQSKYVSLDLSYSTLENIGSSAFISCSSLTSVIIPYSVTGIMGAAFRNCTNLVSVTIPASVTSIGNQAFLDCTSLAIINIPASVESIGNNAFRGCASLTSVTIPDGISRIENSAFYDCTNLISITIPASVESIGEWAFASCANLASVTIPASVESIEYYAFYNCIKLVSVTFEGMIASDNFNADAFVASSRYLDELRGEYLTNGPGTYTRETNGTVWTKQE